MTWPNPAMRQGWFEQNFEGHTPTAHNHAGRWRAACQTDGCINPDDPGVLDFPPHDRAGAVEQAAHILTGRTHGPTDKELT